MKKKYGLIGLLLVIFIVITTLVVTNNTIDFDNTIYNTIFSIRNSFWDMFFKCITTCANTLTIICLVIILLLIIKDKYRYILGIATISTVLINQLLKNIIMRPRPDHMRLIKESGYSYPSGHSMISIAVYGFLIYYVYHKIKNKKLKIFLIILLTSLIVLIGLSRIYVGVHYPSDVLGGYVLSLLVLLLVVLGVDKYVKNGSK